MLHFLKQFPEFIELINPRNDCETTEIEAVETPC